MRGTPVVFQPYDRDTGAELSDEQQADCGFHYLAIKAYIDNIDSQLETPLQWSRKKLRCSTTELLEKIKKLSRDIGQLHRETTIDEPGSDGIFHTDSGTSTRDLAACRHSITLDPRFYQPAINLLHELVSRLVDVDAPSPLPLSSTIPGDPPVFQGLSVPGSTSDSSEASAGFSNRPTSLITTFSTGTGTSFTSTEMRDSGSGKIAVGDDPENTTHVVFDIPPADIDVKTVEHEDKKKIATNDWVLEYLRGGWLESGPSDMAGVTISPVFTMSEDSSPACSFRPPNRTDSDEVSLFGDDIPPFGNRNTCSGTRPSRRGYPIPTVASRFMGKAPQQGFHSIERKYSPAFGLEHFETPQSVLSGNTVFCTPHSGLDNIKPVGLVRTSTWNAYLRERGLIPNPFDEMDWSGRGQHAEFNAEEECEVPLILEKALGHSATALVESVRCRRIRLARKTVTVNRRLKKEEVIKEVEHLQRLKHPHVIRVVGTYTLPQKLSILLYPVAEYTLDQFLESTQDSNHFLLGEYSVRLYSISSFLRCLAKGLAYIHEKAMKHMDIKPKNLLVRDMRNSTICNQGQYKIYIADFGIARSYKSVDDCNTESRTAFTRMYAAPEVVAQERRDQKADIFSLGAVYAEILAVLANQDSQTSNLDLLGELREANNEDQSYQANITNVQSWLRGLSITTYGFESDANYSSIAELVALMLSVDPEDRPTALTILDNIPFLAFCCDVNGGPEPFEAAERQSDRQLYDRSMEIAEQGLKYFRCMVDGCVKVYRTAGKLEYHEAFQPILACFTYGDAPSSW
ncbi:kinase-like protein [Delitschia confertaspora ATCC 74209]|uniref:Kinase-like protein n=1 Tax=Delitschia confertaspora ATCC 74209 TaxID=1513339 RepID=A0A9P4MRR1_9PLEO|nr:kinase-like protein [Delitschia confertaspora ATCC 74209]